MLISRLSSLLPVLLLASLGGGCSAAAQTRADSTETAVQAVSYSTEVSSAPLSLDDCRRLALRHNKSLELQRVAVQKAKEEQRAARTNYLPKLSATVGLTHMSEQVSLLNDEQKTALSGLGTGLASELSPTLAQMAQGLLALHPELAPLVQSAMGGTPALAQRIDAAGRKLVEAFDTDTRNVAVGTLLLTQPLYMGGKIRAYDRITRYSTSLAGERLRAEEQTLLLDVDRAYWQVVSLANKQRLATAYRDMLQHLHQDVEKMRIEGVATRANELSVSVELNKSEMTLTQVEDGLTLSRMLLAQLCGLPMSTSPSEQITLADEALTNLSSGGESVDVQQLPDFEARPELRQLRLATQIYDEKIKIERAAFLPTVALTAGVISHYPSLSNGFEKKFSGAWNVALLFKMPLWTWGEGRHKINAARAEARMTRLRQEETHEKIELQVRQSAFAVREADKKLGLSEKNLTKAEENLRMARVGFDEGMIPTSDLLAAQTAWLAAHNDKIDAQIDTRLTRAIYRKAIGQSHH